MTRFLLRLSFLVAVGCSASVSTPPGSDGPKPDSTPLKPDMTVSAVELVKEFGTDKATADEKYKGKVLTVDGEVKGALSEHGTRRVLLLKGVPADLNKSLFGCDITCYFDGPEAKKVIELTPGQKVTVTGKYQGFRDLFVGLSDCRLDSVGLDPSIAVTAAELTKAYTDKNAADKKYKNKRLTVEGKLVEVKEETIFKDVKDGTVLNVILEGFDEKADKPVRVQITCDMVHKNALKSFKKGDTVKMQGECDGPLDGVVLLSMGSPVK